MICSRALLTTYTCLSASPRKLILALGSATASVVVLLSMGTSKVNGKRMSRCAKLEKRIATARNH
eukprot:5822040-Pleurochrysis_carterae.AAC.3